MVVDVAKAHAMTIAARTNPIVRMRPGVVQRNHQRGCAGLVCERDARGSVEGGANSTVTCAWTSAFGLLSRLLNCKGILRAGGGTRGTLADTHVRRPFPILDACVVTGTVGSVRRMA